MGAFGSYELLMLGIIILGPVIFILLVLAVKKVISNRKKNND